MMMLLGPSSSSSATTSRTAALPVVLAALFVGFISYLPQPAEGHAYLMEPVSRNFWATDAFQEPSYPGINWCPHCFQSRGPAAVRARAEEHTDPEELELYGGGAWPHYSAYQRNELASNGNYYEPDAIAVRHGICGDPEQTAAEGSNLFGQDNSNYPVLQTYAKGSVMEVKVAISTNHWGHLEFFICNADDMTDPDGVVTQGCFNMHPLDRASDDDSASRIDPNHVGRYFLDPTCRASETDQTMPPGAFTGDVATARYQLPDGLTCTRCILQMVYYTGNSCKHPGYDEFDPPSWDSECAPNTADWINTGATMCGDGDAYPEEFWNCADIEITSDGDSTPTAPTPSTTSSESEPTPAPDSEASEDEAAPTYMPTPAPNSSDDSEQEEASPTYMPSPAPDASDDSEGEASPTYMPSMSPDVSGEDSGDAAPIAEPTPAPIMYEGYTSTPVQSDDSSNDNQQPSSADEPKTLTMAPATEGEGCDDPVEAYAQCGGDDYDGSTCCGAGYECEDVADCYSECRPIEDGCAKEWDQCGGSDWDGPTCCQSGGVCLDRSESFFQCVPE